MATTKRKATADDLTALDPAPKRKAKPRELKVKPNPVHRWATAGVGITLGLSAWLNGLAFSSTAAAKGGAEVNGWVLGVTIPVLVLVFSRVSALLYQDGKRHLSYCGAAATLSMLLLSVQHCAVSISALTGEPVALAAMMAIAIDAGLVTAEVATVAKKK